MDYPIDNKDFRVNEETGSRRKVRWNPFFDIRVLSVTLFNVILFISTITLTIHQQGTSLRRDARTPQDVAVAAPGQHSACPPCNASANASSDSTYVNHLAASNQEDLTKLCMNRWKRAQNGNEETTNTAATSATQEITTATMITTAATTASSSSTNDNAPDQLRLPKHLRPFHYNVRWRPDFYGDSIYDYTLDGSVEIFFHCHSPTDVISLNFRNLNIDSNSVQVAASTPVMMTDVAEDTNTEVYNITLDRLLAVGENITVSMDFTGSINNSPEGIYWSQYTVNGNTRYMLSTQMETTEARRAFPCVDEPDMKATFTIIVERQNKDSFFSLSNMPLNYTVPNKNDGLWVSDVFETSLVMSTYLVAFVVSDYTSIQANKPVSPNISLWAQNDYTSSGFSQYSSTVAPVALAFYETYFNYSFEMPKLDLVASPKLTFGGMENWGLITFQNAKFLVDPLNSDSSDRQGVTGIVSHEILHNWLGNTVTIAWWSDLWLSEGMARYFQFQATQVVNPTWDAEQLFVAQILQGLALWNDDSGSSTPVYNPALYANSDLDDMFNLMTYEKGASIIRMMVQLLVGKDVFQTGLRNYVDLYQYGNVDHDDLFNEMIKAYVEVNGNALDFNLTEVMYTWIEQMGFPLITVTRSPASSTVVDITQLMYLYQPNTTLEETYQSPFNYLWEVPITYITSQAPFAPSQLTWLHQKASGSFRLNEALDENGWLLVNVNQSGYYRVNYDDGNWNSLRLQLLDNHTLIPTINRGQLLDDSFTLAMSGNVSQTLALQLSEYLSDETEYLPWQSFWQNYSPMQGLLLNSAIYPQLQDYTVQLVTSIYDWIGWDAQKQDDVTKKLLRSLILQMACGAKYDLCSNEALRRFKVLRTNNYDTTIDPDVRTALYCAVAANNNYDDWSILLKKYQNMVTSFTEESSKLLQALTCTTNATTLQSLLDVVQNQMPDISETDYSNLVWFISQTPVGYPLAWNHVRQYEINTISRVDIFKGFALVISTEYELNEVLSYVNEFPPTSDYESSNFNNTIETIEQNIIWRENNELEMNDWIKKIIIAANSPEK